ncbi:MULTISPECIES: YwqI/YxiC family protein [Peribacillus]|uniref:YwqI/YxiC family protein n=1 Tax=Peribacillus TaxID=2675229 RepID=UPI0019129EF0|nr:MULTISPECIES: YwqI/YxiC family protein [unclassified Peribacillus]MBK5441500.1 YwqI/YxiC family protein [Peribacillus sp. TH24]MBK5458567.1 YwqI/YxiC family protein [Peribacillus sp. TH27]MBK5480472.1 YwqI/YxiC family protein [Peribacillus sp. TH16]MBK5501980.1 YwqI/YxiC family protein [Peribacillus sp. TH14]WMX58037.1 YwqI/YxiC family protein [Peribacillus sp. R9-11]
MATIKLNHPAVTKQVNQVKTALGTVTLGNLPADELGKNKLEFTSKWIDREANLEKVFERYIKIVQKNVEDTQANIDLLKEQDDAITHSSSNGYQPR